MSSLLKTVILLVLCNFAFAATLQSFAVTEQEKKSL
jgi:hypothetical protein